MLSQTATPKPETRNPAKNRQYDRGRFRHDRQTGVVEKDGAIGSRRRELHMHELNSHPRGAHRRHTNGDNFCDVSSGSVAVVIGAATIPGPKLLSGKNLNTTCARLAGSIGSLLSILRRCNCAKPVLGWLGSRLKKRRMRDDSTDRMLGAYSEPNVPAHFA